MWGSGSWLRDLLRLGTKVKPKERTSTCGGGGGGGGGQSFGREIGDIFLFIQKLLLIRIQKFLIFFFGLFTGSLVLVFRIFV